METCTLQVASTSLGSAETTHGSHDETVTSTSVLSTHYSNASWSTEIQLGRIHSFFQFE